MQAADGPVQQGPHDRFCRRFAGQLIKVVLDRGGGAFVADGNSPGKETGPLTILF